MSTSAGRVMPIPKGAYDSATTYHVLDIVTYNGSSYICKATTTGNVPTNTTYWQLNASGSAVSSLDEIGDVDITSVTNGQVLKYNSSASKWENGDAESGGILPHIIVISESGSTVSAVKDGTTINFTETSSGHFEGDVTEFGTWTIHAVLSGDDATVSLVVDTVKVYTVDDSHFHADITAYYPKDAGATCALSASGQTTQYATTSPFVFTVHEAGTYTLTVTYDGQTYTDTVSVSATGQTFTKYVPSTSNAPTDDYQMWLFFGGIDNSESTYTSLADILADSSALATLMSTNNAVDYLVRCKEWAGGVGLVPAMTSDTTPSGVASGYGTYAGRAPYMAFDGDDSTYWLASNTVGNYVQYEFPTPQKVSKVSYLIDNDSTQTFSHSIKVSASTDGTNFTELATDSTPSLAYEELYRNTKSISGEYKYFRFECYRDTQTGTSGAVRTIQFYSEDITANQSAMQYIGLNNYCANTLLADSDWKSAIWQSSYKESVLNAKVPSMTSNTTPSGVASAYHSSSGYDAYKAFDGNNSTAWYSNKSYGNYVQYEFPTLVNVAKVEYLISAASTQTFVYSIRVSGSTDGTNFTELATDTSPSICIGGVTYNNTKDISGEYKYFRFESSMSAGSTAEVNALQFYGRTDV